MKTTDRRIDGGFRAVMIGLVMSVVVLGNSPWSGAEEVRLQVKQSTRCGGA